MFLHLLNENQKLEFLKLGRRMIQADDKALDQEKAYLFRLMREAGIKAHQRDAARDGEFDASIFDTRRVRIAAAVEMLVLAHVDGEFADAEVMVAADVFREFEIDAADRADIQKAAENIVEALAIASRLMV